MKSDFSQVEGLACSACKRVWTDNDSFWVQFREFGTFCDNCHDVMFQEWEDWAETSDQEYILMRGVVGISEAK